jgi:hypothetical protein
MATYSYRTSYRTSYSTHTVRHIIERFIDAMVLIAYWKIVKSDWCHRNSIRLFLLVCHGMMVLLVLVLV